MLTSPPFRQPWLLPGQGPVLDEDVTRANLLRLLPDATVVHFVGHGVTKSSAVIRSPPAKTIPLSQPVAVSINAPKLNLCVELTEIETVFPGTDLRLVYEIAKSATHPNSKGSGGLSSSREE